jgi:hypothetical protein
MTGQEHENNVLHCVVVVDQSLAPGLAANATGVLALTLGAMIGGLPGAPLIDADGESHPGLIPQGLPVLRAQASMLSELRVQAANTDSVGVIDFPSDGQQTNDYDEFRRRVASIPTQELRYLGVLIYGPRRAIKRLTGSLALLR